MWLLVDEKVWLIDLATQTFSAIKTGSVGLNGVTATVPSTTLVKLRNLTNQSRQASPGYVSLHVRT